MDNEEINEAVAVTVMGYPKPSDKIVELYSPSTNIAQAFEMEEKIKERFREDDYTKALYFLTTANDTSLVGGYWNFLHATPSQRCQAALKVYGVGGCPK